MTVPWDDVCGRDEPCRGGAPREFACLIFYNHYSKRKPAMTPGYKTTEFWLTIAAAVAVQVSVLLPVGTPGQKIAAAVVAGLAALGYTVGRSMVKAVNSVSGD